MTAGAATRRLSAGVALVIGAGVALATMDAISKSLTSEMHVIQVVWARYFFHALVVTLFLVARRMHGFWRARRFGLQVARAACLFGATLCMYTALTRVPLADATAVQFFAPVLVAVLSVPFLGERLHAGRLAAVLVAFVAVLIIIRPGTTTDPFLLLPLAAAFLLSGYLLLTRFLSRGENPRATQFYTTAVGAVVLSIVVPLVWKTPSPAQWTLMAGAGGFGAMAHFAIIVGMTHAPASLLSPFLYSQILFATILSVVVFGDPLTIYTMAGALLLVASGLYLWRHA